METEKEKTDQIGSEPKRVKSELEKSVDAEIARQDTRSDEMKKSGRLLKTGEK